MREGRTLLPDSVRAKDMRILTVRHYMSNSLNSLKRGLYRGLFRAVLGVINRDTRSLDLSSHSYRFDLAGETLPRILSKLFKVMGLLSPSSNETSSLDSCMFLK